MKETKKKRSQELTNLYFIPKMLRKIGSYFGRRDINNLRLVNSRWNAAASEKLWDLDLTMRINDLNKLSAISFQFQEYTVREEVRLRFRKFQFPMQVLRHEKHSKYVERFGLKCGPLVTSLTFTSEMELNFRNKGILCRHIGMILEKCKETLVELDLEWFDGLNPKKNPMPVLPKLRRLLIRPTSNMCGHGYKQGLWYREMETQCLLAFINKKTPSLREFNVDFYRPSNSGNNDFDVRLKIYGSVHKSNPHVLSSLRLSNIDCPRPFVQIVQELPKSGIRVSDLEIHLRRNQLLDEEFRLLIRWISTQQSLRKLLVSMSGIANEIARVELPTLPLLEELTVLIYNQNPVLSIRDVTQFPKLKKVESYWETGVVWGQMDTVAELRLDEQPAAWSYATRGPNLDWGRWLWGNFSNVHTLSCDAILLDYLYIFQLPRVVRLTLSELHFQFASGEEKWRVYTQRSPKLSLDELLSLQLQPEGEDEMAAAGEAGALPSWKSWKRTFP